MTLFTLLLAQTILVSGGASTLLNADGGNLTLYTPGSTSQLSAGISNGSLVAGASALFKIDAWDLRLGDSQLFLQSGNEGTAVPLRGVDARNGPIELFAGAVGKAYSAPFFAGTRAADLGYGLRLSFPLHHRENGPPPAGYLGPTRHLPDVHFSTVLVRAADKTTALGELAVHGGPLTVGVTGGIVENRTLYDGLAELRWRHFGANATRVTYFVPQQTNLTSEGVAAQAGRFDVYASAFQSRLATGEAVGLGLRAGWVNLRGNEFWERSGHVSTTSVTENLTRRLSLSQFATRSQRRNAFTYGGSWRSNLLTASLGWNTYFQPGVGFKNLPAATVSLQLPRSITVNLSLIGGKWMAYGGMYVSGLGPGAPSSTWRKPKLLDYPGVTP